MHLVSRIRRAIDARITNHALTSVSRAYDDLGVIIAKMTPLVEQIEAAADTPEERIMAAHYRDQLDLTIAEQKELGHSKMRLSGVWA